MHTRQAQDASSYQCTFFAAIATAELTYFLSSNTLTQPLSARYTPHIYTQATWRRLLV